MRAPFGAIVSVLAALGCGSVAPPHTEPRCPEPQACPEPPPVVIASAPSVSIGSCDVAWLPPGTLLDVSPEETAGLADAMRSWLAEGARTLRIETRRGIAYAKSADDLGADPPHPTSTRAQSGLACGVQSAWLADHVQARLARAASPDFGGVVCEENVCCYAGMEFMSRGIVIARRETIDGSPIWVLDSFAEVAEATLLPETVRANREGVARALERERRGTCPGEPPGYR